MNKKLFILSAIATSLVALIFILINYKTSYREVDIEGELTEIKTTLLPNQEIIVFNSKNPFNFNDLLFRIDNISNQQVYGILTYPEQSENYSSNKPLPLVMGVAGSKGWSEHHYKYMHNYLENGFATFTLHSFKSRNVFSTVGEQISATTAMLVYDSFTALKEIHKNPKIDSSRIGITGWSLGGGVALFTAWKPLKDQISPDHAFAAHLPIYPPCFVKPENLEFTDAPIHILIGDSDDWVPADACTDLVESSNLENLNITTYPNSHHSFDREQDIIYVEDAYSFTECRLKLTDDGIVRTKDLGIPLSNSVLQKVVLAFCAERGAHYGGDDKARERSFNFSLEFMDKHLKGEDGCVDFVALWSASDIAEQTGMNKRWVFRNYTVEIWDIPPSDPRPGRIIDELKASSYAMIIDSTDSEYLVESPMTGTHGWLDKTHVKTISRKNPKTKKLCKKEGEIK